MKKFGFSKTYIILALLVVWVFVVVYLVTTDNGKLFKGQFFGSPQTCAEIIAGLNSENLGNATELVDAALKSDCEVPEALLNRVETKLVEEQTEDL